MGRRRLNPDHAKPLPPGLYKEGRKYRARLQGGPWVYFGDEYVAAMSGYAAWRHDRRQPRTVAWLLDLYTGQVCPQKVKANALAARTARDYLRDSAILKKGLGHIPVAALEVKHIAGFRDARRVDAPSHVRNELACLSSALSYAAEQGWVVRNLALEVRSPSKVRSRLITDAEYKKVYDIAGPSVRLAMSLALRTLASNADVFAFGPRNLHTYPDGKRTLRFARGKTKVKVEIEIVGELALVLEPFIANPSLHPTFIRRRDGKAYTVGGLGSMFRRHCVKAKVEDFGIRDLRAKGATDMHLAGVDIQHIQHLLGHENVETTKIYIKKRVPKIVRPNEQPIIAAVA